RGRPAHRPRDGPDAAVLDPGRPTRRRGRVRDEPRRRAARRARAREPPRGRARDRGGSRHGGARVPRAARGLGRAGLGGRLLRARRRPLPPGRGVSRARAGDRRDARPGAARRPRRRRRSAHPPARRPARRRRRPGRGARRARARARRAAGAPARRRLPRRGGRAVVRRAVRRGARLPGVGAVGARGGGARRSGGRGGARERARHRGRSTPELVAAHDDDARRAARGSARRRRAGRPARAARGICDAGAMMPDWRSRRAGGDQMHDTRQPGRAPASVAGPGGAHPPASGDEFLAAVHRNVRYLIGKRWEEAAPRDFVAAIALACRETLVERMFETERRYAEADAKRLYYLSVEFLIGRSLGNTLLNLGLLEPVERSLEAMGVDWEAVVEAEPDAALGNGGLGRLAACYLDSLATLDMPGYGYGINYDYGLFRQAIEGGQQREYPEPWRRVGAAWQIERPERACWVPVYGRAGRRSQGAAEWHDWRVIVGVPYDMPVVGWGGHTVNRLRLFSARSPDAFDIEIFHRGDYLRAFERKLSVERISALLYPSDSTEQGKELRLLQEYFFVACALRDILFQYLERRTDFDALPSQVAIQLNDTHPALAIAEWIRLLVDEHGLPFDRAIELTRGCFAYTNHTLLPEALEHWPRPLLARVIPRHLQIIEDLNARHLAAVGLRWPGDVERLRRLSIFDEAAPKHVRMAHLAVVGSHAVNGVSSLHSELVRTRLLPDFAELWPEKFRNVTNGVTQRRWL